MGKKALDKIKKEKKENSKIENTKEKRKEIKKRKNKKNEKEEKEIEEEIEEENLNIISEKEEKEMNEDLNEKYLEYQEKLKKDLIPNLNKNLIKETIKELSEYIKKKQKENLNILSNEQDEFLYMKIALDKFPKRFSIRPLIVNLKNKIYGENYSTNVCLIVKDSKDDFKELKLEFPFNLKVIDISKLKLKYERFEQRRNLIKQYDIFLCDGRVYFILRKLLGKPFYSQKKFPLPINLDYNNKNEIKNNIINIVENSSIFYLSHGPNYNIKFARVVMNEKEKIENLNDAIINMIPHVLKFGVDLNELKLISIKGNNTIEIPIYNHIKESDLKIYFE